MSIGTALTQTTEPAPRAVASLTGGMVSAIVPKTFDDVYRFAQVVSQSGLCPHGMDTPQKVTVAILTGLEIGVKPMQAVQGIAVIGGRPCVWGDLALGVVRGSGELEWIKEFYEGDLESVDWAAPSQSGTALKVKAICVVKRKGEPETRNEFSIGDAVVAKLWGKRGYNGKDTPWITNPKRMLKMRARGFGLRDQFTDVLKGLYIAEELIGVEEDRATIAGPSAPSPPPAEDRPPELAPPVQAAPAPAAPPAPPVEEAEIVEHPSPAEGGGSAGEVQSVQEQPEAAGGPPMAQEEPFDFEAWMAEARARYAEARTPADVDDVHGGFGDISTNLPMAQRQIYEGVYDEAWARVTAAHTRPHEKPSVTGEPDDHRPAADDEDDDRFPGEDSIQKPATPEKTPGQLYLQRIRTAINDPIRTQASLKGLWEATEEERKNLLASGQISKEERKALRDAIVARGEQRLAADAGPVAPSPPPDQPEEDEATHYDREFRARVEACSTIDEINALSPSTLSERNKFSGHPLHAGWSPLITQRRKQISGIA